MLYFFLFIIWIWLLITVFVDIFRSHDMGGVAKALWVIFVIILPFLGVFVYLIARGGKMHERAAQQAAEQQKAFDAYVKQAAGTSGDDTADQLSKLADLKAKGVITDAEFEAQNRSCWPAPEPGSSELTTTNGPARAEESTMTMGPVSYTVIAFPGNQFNGNIVPEIEKLVANDIVRILDLVFVRKDEQGDTVSLEFDQMDELAAFGDIEGEVGGLVNTEDLDHVAANLPAGNSALVILWEDLWAMPLADALRGSGGVLVDSARIPADLVEAAFAELAEASRAENRETERLRKEYDHADDATPSGDADGRKDGGHRRHGHRGRRRGEPPPAAEVRAAGCGRGAGATAGGRAPPVEAAPDSDELINKLKELANLKDQGILTEAEFNDQKAKILAEMS